MHLKDNLILVAKGFCMGAADVVPGVSGGTMAFILGIYTRFIDAIKSFDTMWIQDCVSLRWRPALARPHFAFLLPLLIGIVSAVLFFTRVVPLPRFLITHPENVYGLFFGLIGASIVVLLREFERLGIRDLVVLGLGLGIGAVVVTAIPAETPETWWFVMLSGALAICAMVVPGISGSFVLLLLGKYSYVLNAIGHFQLPVIAAFASGAALGLFFFTRLLSWILHHYKRQSVMGIIGILIASLWVIWPFQARSYIEVRGKLKMIESTPLLPDWSPASLSASAFVVAGFALVLGLQRLAAAQR